MNNCTPALKICTSCNNSYPATAEYFTVLKGALRNRCRKCNKEANNRYRAKHGDRIRKRNREYKRQHKEQSREWYLSNREKALAQSKARYQKNKTHLNELGREWYKAHKEEVRAYQKHWRLENIERKRQCTREWALKNPERVAEYRRRWVKANRIRRARYKATRKARLASLPNTLTTSEWLTAVEWFRGCCAYCQCREEANNPITADHVIALRTAECPGTVLVNIVPACRRCNSSKRATDVNEWLTRKYGDEKAADILQRINAYFAFARERDAMEVMQKSAALDAAKAEGIGDEEGE